jgi:hypothetical protein
MTKAHPDFQKNPNDVMAASDNPGVKPAFMAALPMRQFVLKLQSQHVLGAKGKSAGNSRVIRDGQAVLQSACS